MDHDRIVAVALLTERDLDLLGPAFKWAWPLDDERISGQFEELLILIDEADRADRAEEAQQRDASVSR